MQQQEDAHEARQRERTQGGPACGGSCDGAGTLGVRARPLEDDRTSCDATVLIFADTETAPIARASLAPPPVCGQWAEDDGPTSLALWQDVTIPRWLANTLIGA